MDARKALAVLLATTAAAAVYSCAPDGGGGSGPTGPSPNEDPSASIVAPADSAERSTEETVLLEGDASDPEDGELSGSSLAWTSDRDGNLGSGQEVEVQGLTAGAHRITLTATDSEGAEASDEITLWAAQPVQAGQPVEGVAGGEDEATLYQFTVGGSGSGAASESYAPAASGDARTAVPGSLTTDDEAPDGETPEASASTQGSASGSGETAAAEGQVLVVRLSGGSGNADLYVRLGEAPTPSAYDCRSAGSDNEEECRIEDPGDGTWYVLVHGEASFSGAVLTAGLEAASSPTGSLEVSASTKGEEPDPDGYTVTVDPGTESARSQAFDPDGSATFTDLAAGEHTVELSGVAANCSVEGSRTRTVEVPDGGTASESYALDCPTTTGSLEASVSTSGGSPDPDGYTVEISGPESRSQSVAADGSVTFGGLAEGEYTVELTGLADNCSVTDGNPKTATVTAGETATVSFAVDCPTPTGDLEVSASTTGEEPDADGYTVRVDPGTDSERSRTIDPDGSATFTDLAAGEHTVELSGVAANCSVEGSRTRTVEVPDGGTASESYALDCPTTTGSLEASVSTSGGSPDPDGYTVELSGPESRSQSVEVDGLVTFGGLAEGEYTVELTGLADNCSVTDGNPKTANVTAGDTRSVSFSVSCNTSPTADLTHSPSSPEVGETVTFDASGSSDADGSIDEYRWDFDDDGTAEQKGASATATHSYASAGEVTARVTVVDDDGATDQATTTVSVVEGNDPPTASLTHSPSSPEVGETVTFDASGSSDPDGSDDIENYGWRFGDGSSDITQDPTVTHSYSSAGEYEASVTVEDENGATDDATTTVTVFAILRIETSSLETAVEGQSYEETLNASGGDGDYSWEIAAGSVPDGLSLTPDGVISGEARSNDERFTVEVTDGTGRTATKEFTLEVHMRPDPSIENPSRRQEITQFDNGNRIGWIVAEDEWPADQEIPFLGTADDPDGQTDFEFEWVSSIDGNLPALQSFNQELSAGDHNVFLNVTDADGVTGTESTQITAIPTGKTLTVSVHSDVSFSSSDVLSAIQEAETVLQVNDGSGNEGGDVSCGLSLDLDGSVGSPPSDVPPIIDSAEDLDAALSAPANVVVVQEISYCDGPGEALGCASGTSRDVVIVPVSSTYDEGVVWAHEWGHIVGSPDDPGLKHRDDDEYVMYETAVAGGNQRKITINECAIYRHYRNR